MQTPLDRWISGSESITLTDEFGGCGVLVWLGHWSISVYSQLTSEGESEVSEPVLSVEGHIKLCLLLIIVVKIPSWRLAMNSVNQVWITVLRRSPGDNVTNIGRANKIIIQLVFVPCVESRFSALQFLA